MTKLICEECNEQMFSDGGESTTLVGYMSPPGHNHDDNCRKRYYRCSNGHGQTVSAIQKCSAPGCDWTGRTECGCCGGAKVDEWYD